MSEATYSKSAVEGFTLELFSALGSVIRYMLDSGGWQPLDELARTGCRTLFVREKGAVFSYARQCRAPTSFEYAASPDPRPIPLNHFLKRIYYCANMCRDYAAATPRTAPLAR